ncbi:MAG: hypothetical protein RL301_396, partial [Actinomycetota bacterium]
TGSADNYEDLLEALTNVHTAFYLLHSINYKSDFTEIETEMAKRFATAAKAAGVTQIVYLGGIANDKKISTHLSSRVETGKALASTGIPVMEIRAGIIIGSGSASFEMLRHLTHRLPIMTTPKWVSNRTQPIAIRDVLWYLTNAANLSAPVSGVFDIGGPEVLTYESMMQSFAKIAGLRKRIIIKVPVLTPGLSSLWIGFVTPVPTTLARPLVGSLISEVVVDPSRDISKVIAPPPGGPSRIDDAIKLALSRTNENAVDTRWSDAQVPTAPWQKAQSDPSWAGDRIFKDTRLATTDKELEKVWAAVERIGGSNGWYGSDFLWILRGLIDRVFGGVGLRRGRRDPLKLRVGDSLDFWRVEEVIPNEKLRLYAEMILPGKAWLEFRIEKLPKGVSVTQEASFVPRGLGGQLYWFFISPFHLLIFPTMLRNLIKSA